MRADNDNSPGHVRIRAGYKEREEEIRYEFEDDLIEAMNVEQRVAYRRHGTVPAELRYLADRVEANIAREISIMRRKA